MARTWQGNSAKQLSSRYSERHAEGPDPAINYSVFRTAQGFQFEVQMAGQQGIKAPVETTVGGERHGLSFLLRVRDIGGATLPRAPLVEARYLHYAPENHLELSPGFPPEKPSSYYAALGRVLTPGFEKKCLSCHGEPRIHGSRVETGIGCESCHGPGRPHLLALGRKLPDKSILNPRKLPAADQMRPCAQCHSGFSLVQDPLPDDTLISSQVTALSNSECWRQTAGEVTCTNCHSPHQDAPRGALVSRSEKTCLGCHNAGAANHAGLCPVNRTTGCVGCHMPESTKRPPFLITDHWIRVHPEQNVTAPERLNGWRSMTVPKHLYLRMIQVTERSQAAALREQLLAGASFFDLARTNSIDQSSAANGGYLGDLAADQLDPTWSKTALALRPGELSGVVDTNGRYVILQRLPRNFREDAEGRFEKAMEMRKQGRRQEAAAELLEALKLYPHLLRALTYLGVIYGEAGNPQTGAGILTIATQLYPRDAGAHFNLGIAYGAMGKDEEIAEYKSALEIDPDLVPAYLNWGASLYAKGKYEEAIRVYRQGVDVNPLIASLHYSLSLALGQVQKAEEAQAEMQLALKIDPDLTKR
jgi:predicted CXXCH cytochrome family protein